MSSIYPFIKFNDKKCQEGMNFYKDALGGVLEFNFVKDSPMGKDFPAEGQDLVMHSTLKVGDFVLVASDMMRDKAVIGDNVGVFLECSSKEEIESAFAKLSAGGEMFMPLAEQFWGATFGTFTDMYGVEWMLNYNHN